MDDYNFFRSQWVQAQIRKAATPIEDRVYDGEGGCQECGIALNNAVSYKNSGLCVACYYSNM